MRKRLLLTVVLVLGGAAVAAADTVRLRDGSTFDGVVSRSDSNGVVLQMGGGTVSLPAADVVSIEKNDKKGDTNKLSRVTGQKHNDSLFERTGLTREQRDTVRDAIEPLWSPDEAQRNAARKKLVEMGRQMPVFQFIETTMPYAKGLVVPELMQVLVDIDPKRAKNVLIQHVEDLDPGNRAKALKLIASYKQAEDLDTLARGVKDPDNSVRVAAVEALAKSGDPRTTPALIEGLRANDPRVQNAARTALSLLWQTELKTTEEWAGFWSSRAGNVKDPIDPAKLAPLVTAEELARTNKDHDE